MLQILSYPAEAEKFYRSIHYYETTLEDGAFYLES
jgi:hypothetical protein